MVQLEKYDAISQRRKQIAAYYNEHLNVPKEGVLPPLVEGAAYSHYASVFHGGEKLSTFWRPKEFKRAG
jgi:dTDP-4-amino-4,6-dideoxygalactose transaminase